MAEKGRKVRVLHSSENADSLWSDHSGESARSQASTPVKRQLVVASGSQREGLRLWFQREPRTRHDSLKWYTATVEELQNLKSQVSAKEYKRMLRHGALRHEGGVPAKYFAGVNFGRAHKLESDEYPAQRNTFAALPLAPADQPLPLATTPRSGLATPPGFPEKPSSSESSSEDSLSPVRGSRRSSSNGGSSEGWSRGRRRLKKKKKKKTQKKKAEKQQKQRGAKAADKGKAVATTDDYALTPEMAVQTLFKDKALRDQAFACRPEERQRAIARAAAWGRSGAAAQSQTEALEEWRCPLVPITVEQNIREHVRQHNSSTEEAMAIAATYSTLAVIYGLAKNHRARESLSSPGVQLIGREQGGRFSSGSMGDRGGPGSEA
ncbi:hypothetical protein CYMTET_36872 [Cymbomonas tetramitiformis]|uniref:Uncharacterized protein n=1 Tax=Cymbomonas tetramitiformis TaxID=36881 RepID=A0AAE0CGI0_9CHLO|nr:hypothetical protein CYMTET_36872 [Cymbomonas tetramitiformis]